MIKPFELLFYMQTLEALYGNLNKDIQTTKALLYEEFAIIANDKDIDNIFNPKINIDSSDVEEDAYLIYAHCM